MSEPGTQTVVLVHGIWMLGLEMQLLARRLRLAGYRVGQFRYPSVRGHLEDNLALLRQHIAASEGQTVHLVCHSLGGLLTHELLERAPLDRPGRVVALGSPFNGSWTVLRIEQLGLQKPILGNTILPLLRRGQRQWNSERDLGVIAGSCPLGIGPLLGAMPQPNDGIVTLQETRLSGATAHAVACVNHFGLLVSRPVFGKIVHFLRSGFF